MRRRVFSHAGARRLRCVGDELIGRFGGERGRRLRRWRRRLRLLFFEFHDEPADEQAVEYDPKSYHEWDYSDHPHAAKDVRLVRRLLPRYDVEEEIEEDHQACADEAADDASLDFIKPFIFSRDAATPFPFLFGEEHVRHPGLAPVELSFGGSRYHSFARTVEIRSALPAEFEIIVDLKSASWTEH